MIADRNGFKIETASSVEDSLYNKINSSLIALFSPDHGTFNIYAIGGYKIVHAINFFHDTYSRRLKNTELANG